MQRSVNIEVFVLRRGLQVTQLLPSALRLGGGRAGVKYMILVLHFDFRKEK